LALALWLWLHQIIAYRSGFGSALPDGADGALKNSIRHPCKQ
jgi:hypothetical protein